MIALDAGLPTKEVEQARGPPSPVESQGKLSTNSIRSSFNSDSFGLLGKDRHHRSPPMHIRRTWIQNLVRSAQNRMSSSRSTTEAHLVEKWEVSRRILGAKGRLIYSLVEKRAEHDFSWDRPLDTGEA